MTKKRPWMPFYVLDWLNDREVRLMSRAARSMYFDLLCIEWVDGPLPDDVAAIARLLGEDRRTIAAVWSSIRARFAVDSTGKLIQLRLESELNRIRIAGEKAAKSAEARWSRDANAMHASIARAMLSDSDSESHSDSEIRKIPDPGSASPPPAAVPEQVTLAVQEPPKRRSPAKPEVAALISAYQRRWVETRRPDDGKPPRIGKADFAQARSLVRDHGQDQALAFVERFLADADPWLTRQGHPLRLITARINAYRATAPPRSNALKFEDARPAVAITGEVQL